MSLRRRTVNGGAKRRLAFFGLRGVGALAASVFSVKRVRQRLVQLIRNRSGMKNKRDGGTSCATRFGPGGVRFWSKVDLFLPHSSRKKVQMNLLCRSNGVILFRVTGTICRQFASRPFSTKFFRPNFCPRPKGDKKIGVEVFATKEFRLKMNFFSII